MDFNAQVDKSFLPEIIRLAQENKIQLIFVHARTLTYPTPDSQPAELATYKRDLAAYLAAHNVPLLDFSFDERFPSSLFNDPLHMNDEGQALFSQILGEAFLKLIQTQEN
jgi:lysophospholipase L1-like esterase